MRFPLFFIPLVILINQVHAFGSQEGTASAITSNGITWTFAEEVTYGTFITGDFWVVGPVTVIDISNDLNSPDYTPREGQNGSMLNPLIGHSRSSQGYDDGLNSYDASLNVGRPNGELLSVENPLVLQPNDTLISMVSWLYNSSSDKEPGTPSFNGGTQAPRPVTRAAGILTVMEEAPPDGSFRPPYAGNDNTILYQFDDLDWSRLLNLTPPSSNVPNVNSLVSQMSKPWVDHVFEYLGAMIHPSSHMPNYGRDMGHIALKTALMLHLDFDQLSLSPSKDAMLINLVQYGIDLTGIAENGGGWRANGGHALGRKWPILFAGLMLNDEHMQNVGTWGRNDGTSSGAGTEFQEFQNCFYVSQAEVDLTNSDSWKPDSRDVTNGKATPYTEDDIGTPEWGIRHSYRPTSDNAHIDAIYRGINAGVHPGFALAVHLMQAETLWNHDAFLDYCDRIMDIKGGGTGSNGLPPFAIEMWDLYRNYHDIPLSYEAYMELYFSPEEMLDDNIVGETRDPDMDGKENLYEYFEQTHPNGMDLPAIQVGVKDAYLKVELQRIIGVTGVLVDWEISGDPGGPWTSIEPMGTMLKEALSSAQAIEYLFDFPDETSPAFIRLTVSEREF